MGWLFAYAHTSSTWATIRLVCLFHSLRLMAMLASRVFRRSAIPEISLRPVCGSTAWNFTEELPQLNVRTRGEFFFSAFCNDDIENDFLRKLFFVGNIFIFVLCSFSFSFPFQILIRVLHVQSTILETVSARSLI